MPEPRPVTLDGRWEDGGKVNKGYLILNVFCVGKWRPTCIRARAARAITEFELLAVRRQIRMNTANGYDLQAITIQS